MQYINHFLYSLNETPKNDFTLTLTSHFVSLFIIHIKVCLQLCLEYVDVIYKLLIYTAEKILT